MRKITLYIICYAVLILGCNSQKRTINRDIEIIIASSESYKYDISKGIYTIHGIKEYDSLRKTFKISKTPINIRFSLSED